MAFLMINVKVGCKAEVIEELKAIPGVHEVYQIYGVYDIIIRVEAETIYDLKEILLSRVRNLDKIRSTLTMICI